MTLFPSIIEQIKNDLSNTPYKAKEDILRTWSQILGRSRQNIYAIIRGKNKDKKREGSPVSPEYYNWTRIVFAIKKSPPDGAGEISTDQAAALAVKWGKLPEDALLVPIGTFNAIARQIGLSKKGRRVSRFQASRPNMAHHFDASSSKFLYIAGKTGDGDYIVKVHRPGSGDYKNKPIPCDRLRPWYYGVVDDHSGRLEGTIFAAEGETAGHSLKAICMAWEEMGMPDQLLADQGMLKKGFISKDLIARLDVRLPESMPYAKEAHGKIERPWRTAWQRFEKPFYAGDWKNFNILLSELKAQLKIFLTDDYNQLPHRFEKQITKMQAWERINLQGGIVRIPADAIATAAKRRERTIGADGILRYEGRLYEVKHLFNAKVIVFEGVFSDRLVVQDKADGKKYEVRDFAPLDIGEYRAHPETPHQKLIKESAEILEGAAPMLYADKKSAPENIIAMPTRVKEEREIADPFDITVYPTLKEALKEFMEIVGQTITDGERRDTEALIMQHGLKKVFVT
ncbi:MAG: hypothetical protein HY265_06305, partial [Deltaproteobacteria bacterium]|nr:hypothetical protein [Deltaproteobacteria bacterium]